MSQNNNGLYNQYQAFNSGFNVTPTGQQNNGVPYNSGTTDQFGLPSYGTGLAPISDMSGNNFNPTVPQQGGSSNAWSTAGDVMSGVGGIASALGGLYMAYKTNALNEDIFDYQKEIQDNYIAKEDHRIETANANYNAST